MLLAEDDEQPVKELVRPVHFVPDSKRSDDLLEEMRNRGEQLLVVVDEYGGAVGIVTIEDLLEELVGEIRDEREAAEPAIRRLAERRWRVPARTEIEEVNRVVGCDLPEGDYETVGGLVLSTAGRIPRRGEVIRIKGGFVFRITDANERAVVLVHLTVPPV